MTLVWSAFRARSRSPRVDMDIRRPIAGAHILAHAAYERWMFRLDLLDGLHDQLDVLHRDAAIPVGIDDDISRVAVLVAAILGRPVDAPVVSRRAESGMDVEGGRGQAVLAAEMRELC